MKNMNKIHTEIQIRYHENKMDFVQTHCEKFSKYKNATNLHALRAYRTTSDAPMLDV